MAITNKDIEKLKEHFATKEDLDNKFKEVHSVLEKHSTALLNQTNKLLEHDGKFDLMNEKIDGKFDQVLTGLDKIVGELEKAREDRVFAKGKDDEQDRRLGSLEGGTQKVEAKAGMA